MGSGFCCLKKLTAKKLICEDSSELLCTLNSIRAGTSQQEENVATFRRASEWLYRQKNVQPMSCEVIELCGVYQVGADTESLTDPASNLRTRHKKGIPSYLKVIRIWYRRVDEWQPLDTAMDKPILKYMNLMPARLESTPRAFGPKFQTLNDAIQSLNQRLQENPRAIKGILLNIQTSVCRFSTKHCGIDPDRTFWMANNTDDMHITYFFRIFYIKSKSVPRIQIGFQDFTPHCDWKSKKRRDQQVENFSSLVEQSGDWLRQHPELTLLNSDSVVHNAYYRCARDTPGMESRALDNPHFRSTYWGLMDYVRILRVFYTQQIETPSGADKSSSTCQLVTKVFHVHPAVPTESVRFASVTSRIPLNHDQLMHKINDWITQRSLAVVGMETTTILSNLTKISLSADDTVFQASNKGPAYALYGLRLFLWLPKEQQHTKAIDLSPDPKTIRLDEDSCDIL